MEYGKCLSPQLEKNKCHPLSIYGKAKYLASRYLLRNKKKFTVIILRLYQVYGPYQKKDRLIPNVITNCLQNNLFNCTDGQQLRDFMYIDDLINLIVRIIKAKKNNSGIFNVGTSKPLKVRDVIEKIKAIIKKGKPNYGSITMRPDETEKLYPNIEKVCKKYNWIPKIKIINGLKKTINYYKKENSYKY